MNAKQVCRDYGRPGCLGDIDETQTMRFDEIGEEPIYWCSHCGPEANALDKALMEFMKADPKNIEKVAGLIEKMEHAPDCDCGKAN